MSEPIKVGDLVIIVKPSPCCNSWANVGKIFRVGRIPSSPPACWCSGCLAMRGDEPFAFLENSIANGHIEVRRIKRIPPLEDLQTYRQTDETTA